MFTTTTKVIMKTPYLYAILFFTVVAIGGYFVFTHDQHTPVAIADTEDHAFWRERIREVGSKNAYEEFAASVAGVSRGWQHEQAHTFGGALYQEVGTEGLATCDSRFDYGCFHEFLGRAIAELGIASVAELNATCIRMLGKDSGFCQHGLGHGIQSYFGYSDEHFFEAIEVCSDLPQNDPIGGCIGGIFMEYNLRSMLADDRIIRESADPHYPCNELEQTYVPACYFWQPQWWYEEVIQEEEQAEVIFAELGNRCDAVMLGKAMKEICFSGIGNIVQRGDTRGSDNACDFVSDNHTYTKLCWDFVQ